VPTSLTFDVLIVADLQPPITRHFGKARTFSDGPPPSGPGIYVWTTRKVQAIAYLASTSSLSARLGEERRWIAEDDPETSWQATVVHLLTTVDAKAHWLATATHDDALELELDLIEWHRACVGTAPLIAGWDAKPLGARSASALRMRALWDEVRAAWNP
jgi:hypothetical protein